jgi:tetratricopeptide (TPR) repeat protein
MSSRRDKEHHSARNEQLSPPGTASGPAAPDKGYLLIVGAAFLLLLFGLVGVLFFLPGDKVAEHSRPAESDVRPEQPATINSAPLVNSLRPAAVAAREAFLTLKIEAESENVIQWGGDDYRAVEKALTQGDDYFQNEDFAAAAGSYQRASELLQALTDSREQRLTSALRAAEDMLGRGQAAEAQLQFRQALLIEPSSEQARDGLERAESAAAVQSHYQGALTLEADNRLEEAAARLRKALELDAGYEPAVKLLQSIEARIGESIFAENMNVLFAALERQDFATANRSLETLKSLGIKAEQTEQAEKLLTEKQKQVFVERLRTQAAAFEDSEQWQQALERYDKILQAAPDALFAVAGKQNAVRRGELQRALDQAIERPQRLQEKEQRDAARRLLDYAARIDPRGPGLETRINALSTLLAAAETPVPITLESDNQTDVVIYHVGRIGAFFTHRLSLEPGTYTVVGSKPGYRDVRKEMTIAADGAAYRFDIRCEEPI